MKKNSMPVIVAAFVLAFVLAFSGCAEEPTESNSTATVQISSAKPTGEVTKKPSTGDSTENPTENPTEISTENPTAASTENPTEISTENPTVLPTVAPTNPPVTVTSVYLDQSKGVDTAAGTKSAPVKTIDKAFALLQKGGTIYVVGTYTFDFISQGSTTVSNYVIKFPEVNGKVTITSANKSSPSVLSFKAGTKTTLQPVSPIEFNNLKWEYDHDKINGKAGNMNIYSGPELTFGENMEFVCANDKCNSKPQHENCIAVRGGWHTAAFKGSIYKGDDIKITILSGKLAYVNGGNADGTMPVGNSEINIGGTAEIIQRLQLAGSNGGDVSGNITVNITGGTIGSGGSEFDSTVLSQYGLVVIGHGKADNKAEIGGNVVINIKGGVVNTIHTARTKYESLKGSLSLTIEKAAKVGKVTIDSSYLNTAKNNVLKVPDSLYDVSGFGDFWSDIITF